MNVNFYENNWESGQKHEKANCTPQCRHFCRFSVRIPCRYDQPCRVWSRLSRKPTCKYLHTCWRYHPPSGCGRGAVKGTIQYIVDESGPYRGPFTDFLTAENHELVYTQFCYVLGKC